MGHIGDTVHLVIVPKWLQLPLGAFLALLMFRVGIALVKDQSEPMFTIRSVGYFGEILDAYMIVSAVPGRILPYP